MLKNAKTIKRYNRYSYFYDLFDSLTENSLFKKWRREIITRLKGKVLEIGVGTGKNLEYYNNEVQVTAIDFTPKMLGKARKKLHKLGKSNIELIEMDAQNMSFPDNTFDYVITTFVWCSVPAPVKGLKEARRVLKPDGQAIFLEHVLSKNKLLAFWEYLHNPITRFLFGFNVNRKTRENIERAGFRVVEDRDLALKDVFRLFRVNPAPREERGKKIKK